MNWQPTLEDDLIILRPLLPGDFEALYQLASDPLIWEQHPSSDRYKKEKFLKFFTDSINSRGALIILQKSNGKIIGSSRFQKLQNAASAIEIGWSFLARANWGGQYNKAAKHLMINYAFEQVENVVFYIAKDNIRSQKAAEKIGAIKTAKPALNNLIRKDSNEWTYYIRKSDWMKPNTDFR